MLIAVGSLNPIKKEAVQNALVRVFPQESFIFECFDTQSGISGVSSQPMSDEEAIQGAKTRAKFIREKFDADFGFGLEGSVMEVNEVIFLTGWVAVLNRAGECGLGGGGRIELPPRVALELRKRERELGKIIDEFIGGHNTKQGVGTTGILTNNLIPRSAGFEMVCIQALARFMNPEFYD